MARAITHWYRLGGWYLRLEWGRASQRTQDEIRLYLWCGVVLHLKKQKR